MCVLTGIALAPGLLAIDKASGYQLVGREVTGSAASVQTVLTVASTSLVTLTSVALSLTLVAVQLAMGQFSPRIVRSILHDRRSRLRIGLFIGTSVYSMTVLREGERQKLGRRTGARSCDGGRLQAHPSAIVTLVLFVNHTAQSIRVGGVIGLVGDETRDEIERLYRATEEAEADPSVVPAPDYGVVVKLHHGALVAIAKKADCVLEMMPAMGDFVRGARHSSRCTTHFRGHIATRWRSA
jgi:uncharacterized membrane protein